MDRHGPAAPRHRALCVLRAAAFCAVCVLAPAALRPVAPLNAAEQINIDELPRKTIPLPNGQTVDVITYNDTNWRVVAPALLAERDLNDPSVCFEAKFDQVIGDRLKLFGQKTANVILDARLKLRASSDLKRNDNLWACGTVRKLPSGEVVILAVELVRQPPDVQKFEARIRSLQLKGDADRMIDLGKAIDEQTRQDVGFENFGKLELLRDKAWDLGLMMKEAALKPDDAGGHFALAVMWRDLRKRHGKYSALIRRTLQIDPGHAESSRLATEDLQMVKIDGKWLTKAEKERLDEELEKERKRQKVVAEAQETERLRQREQAERERPLRVLDYTTQLRDSEGAARKDVLARIGEAIRVSVDSGFGVEAAELLAGADDPAAVSPGLETAGRSELAAVRRAVAEALVWRGGSDPDALPVLGKMLAVERDLDTARSAIGAAKSLRPRLAAGVLLAGLENPDRALREELIEGLKTVARQPLTTKEDWQRWWLANQATFDPQ